MIFFISFTFLGLFVGLPDLGGEKCYYGAGFLYICCAYLFYFSSNMRLSWFSVSSLIFYFKVRLMFEFLRVNVLERLLVDLMLLIGDRLPLPYWFDRVGDC